MIIKVCENRKQGYAELLMPMVDERNADHFDDVANGACTWCYYNDGKKHGRIPVMVLPGLVDIFGGESAIRRAGYRKHWNFFQDLTTGEYTFGNKPSFSKGDADDQERAKHMLVITLDDIVNL